MSRAWNSISLGLKTPAHLLLLVWVLLVGGSSAVVADAPCNNCACSGIRQDFTGCLLTYLQDTPDGRAIFVNVNPNYYSCCENLPPGSLGDNTCITHPVQCLLTNRAVSIAYWRTPTDCTAQPDGASKINAFARKPGCDGSASP